MQTWTYKLGLANLKSKLVYPSKHLLVQINKIYIRKVVSVVLVLLLLTLSIFHIFMCVCFILLTLSTYFVAGESLDLGNGYWDPEGSRARNKKFKMFIVTSNNTWTRSLDVINMSLTCFI